MPVVNVMGQRIVGTWSPMFLDNLHAGLTVAGWTVNLVETTGLTPEKCFDSVAAAPACDVWFCADKDWGIPYLFDNRPEPVVSHCHGGPENRMFIDAIGNLPDDAAERYLKMAHVTVNTEAHKKLFCSYWDNVPPEHVQPIGFPMDPEPWEAFRNSDEPRTRILVNGRIDPGKYPVMLSCALLEFADQVTFSSGLKLSESYSGCSEPIGLFLRRQGFEVREGCRGDAYRQTVAEARVIVSAGIHDTLNLSVAEGFISGAALVLPDTELYRSLYDEQPGVFFYPAFDIERIAEAVDAALRSNVGDWKDAPLFRSVDRDTVCARLSEVLTRVVDNS